LVIAALAALLSIAQPEPEAVRAVVSAAGENWNWIDANDLHAAILATVQFEPPIAQ
jgi:hypothetical protein